MDDYFEETLRLYRRDTDGLTFVWIYAFEDDAIYVDEGKVGEMADRAQHPVSDKAKIDALITEKRAEGYAEIDEEDMAYGDVIFAVEGDFANEAEFEKRNALWDALDEHLALTGQGWVDGASTGMGTMELGLVSVDPDISKRVIAAWLKDTPWKDFKAIEFHDD